MKLVGLTGGIACGKSLCSAEIERHVPLIDCDQIAHDVVKKGRWGWRRVRRAFAGHDIFLPDGSLDREKLGKVVFEDARLRRRLNAATHLPIVVVDMPLLFEQRCERLFADVLVVTCAPATQLRRLQQRNDMSEADAKARIAAQMPMGDKEAKASIVIRNDGSKSDTIKQVQRAVVELQRQSWRHLLLCPPCLVVCAAAVISLCM